MKRILTLEDAIAIAALAHKSQTDKNGEPYILHPLRVMLRLDDESGMMAGVLHDTLEDTELTAEDLLAQGCPAEVVEAVELLSKQETDGSYEGFLDRIIASGNDIARRVKIADIEDNTDPTRTAKLSEAVRLRLAEKYGSALEKLRAAG